MLGETQIEARSDPVLAALIEGLEMEFGYGAGAALAQRFLDAEHADFLWDARRRERWLGRYAHAEAHELELDRVRVLGFLDGRWFVATMIVDGNGNPHGMLGCRDFEWHGAAQAVYANA